MDTREYGNSLGVYLVTFWIEASTAIFRVLLLSLLFLPFGFLLALIYLLLSGSLAQLGMFGGGEMLFDGFIAIMWFSLFLGGLLAFIPLGLSMLSYLGAGGGYGFTRFALGARSPSTREDQILAQELSAIHTVLNREIHTFSGIFIIDTPLERVYTIGTALYISSETVRNSRYLGALLAHELGHLNHNDGGLVLSLRRLVFPLFYLLMGNVTSFSTGRSSSGRGQKGNLRAADVYYSMVNGVIFFLFATIGGGLGVWLCSFWWADYFRKRDYLADRFVVACGLQDQLLDYLERNIFYDVSVPYMLGWQPANELRIDRLLNPTAALLAIDSAPLVESATRKYGGLLLVSFVAAIFFGFMLPLGAIGFWLSFLIFIAVGLFFRGDWGDLGGLVRWLLQAPTQKGQYLRITGLAWLLALLTFYSLLMLMNVNAQAPFFLFLLFFGLLVIGFWLLVYSLRAVVLGVNDLESVLRGIYNRLKETDKSAATPNAAPSSQLPPSASEVPQSPVGDVAQDAKRQAQGEDDTPSTQ